MKMFQLLFVSLVSIFVTGCAGLNQKLAQYHIRQGWQGPSMEDMAPDRKLPRSQLPPKLVPNSSYTFDNGYGYRYSHSQGESTSVNRSWDPWSGPRFDVNRSSYNNTYESYTLRPVYPDMVTAPAPCPPNASGYIPLKPGLTPLK